MALIRARQRALTAVTPHQGNRTHVVPNRPKRIARLRIQAVTPGAGAVWDAENQVLTLTGPGANALITWEASNLGDQAKIETTHALNMTGTIPLDDSAFTWPSPPFQTGEDNIPSRYGVATIGDDVNVIRTSSRSRAVGWVSSNAEDFLSLANEAPADLVATFSDFKAFVNSYSNNSEGNP